MSPLFKRRLAFHKGTIIFQMTIATVNTVVTCMWFYWWNIIFIILPLMIVWHSVFKTRPFEYLKDFKFDGYMALEGDVFDPHSKHVLFKFVIGNVSLATDGRFVCNNLNNSVAPLSKDSKAYFKSCVKDL